MTWLEKSGTFENAKGMIQGFEQAIAPRDNCKIESQIGLDLLALATGQKVPGMFNAAEMRQAMAATYPDLRCMVTDVQMPVASVTQVPDMEIVEI